MTKEQKQKIKVAFLPSGKEVNFYRPTSLKEAINKAEIDFPFPCGGKGKCGKCRVKIKGNLNPPTSQEKKIIPDALSDGYRLACQSILQGDAEVEIPVSSLVSDLKFLTEDTEEEIKANSSIKKIYLHLSNPTLEDQASDITRIRRELKREGLNQLKVGLDVAKKVPSILRKGDFKVTLVLDNNELVTLEEGDTRGDNFGLALDVGTTTLAGTLVDLDTGKRMAGKTMLNPQINYGDDVVSRVSYLQENKGGLRELQNRVLRGINKIIEDLIKETGIQRENIYQATVVGNTVMQHLLTGLNPLHVALYPYVPVIQDSIYTQSSSIGIKINPLGRVFVFPNIAAFVGGDTVGVILSTGMHRINKKIRLTIDIGTNGEIVLSHKGKLMAASTAAGPAFEGARISQGMWAQEGAIEKVRLENGEVIVQIIGDGEPRGICGSGLIDAISELYRVGVVDESGRIKPPGEQSGLWAERIVQNGDNSKFILAAKDNQHQVCLTQRDIREFQLAKAAICTGVKMLLSTAKVKKEEVEEVLLAGAFGNYVNIENAYRVGLLPFFPRAEVRNVGNAAGMGAVRVLLSQDQCQEAEKIPSLVQYVELAADPNFQNLLSDSIFLGRKN